MAGFELHPEKARSVASTVRGGSELAAQAGLELAELGVGLPPPLTGRRLLPAIDALSAGWTDVLDDVVVGLAQLGGWLNEAVTLMVAADDEAFSGFRGVPR